MAEKRVVSKESKAVATADVYDILRRPIISEKAAKLSEANGIVFEIAPTANKKDVAKAVSAIYNVVPEKINIVNAKGKVKSFRNKNKGARRMIKKAYVTLPKGQTIDILAESAKK
ncbi:MAG: 50S ribosomal protein L23 [Rickettsiales bacterium]|nr:50S ribosomal protein L23 [Rickettsiales bacterium]